MRDYQTALLRIVKSLLNGQQVEKVNITAEMLAFASSHSLEHVLGYASSDKSVQMITARHVLKQDAQLAAADEIMENCEKNGIYVMPLKGVCVAKRYRDTSLRSMGDIDLLYKADQLDSLRDMMKRLGYEWKCEGAKHEHFFKDPCVSVEMHHRMLSQAEKYSEYYEGIWNKAVRKEYCEYVHELSVEDELIFFMVHLLGHFKYSGVGIRLIMDLYVYNRAGINKEYVQAELEKLHLFEFYTKLSVIAEKWFGDAETDDQTILKLEDYILDSGLYGSLENNSALSMSKVNGKLDYFIKHCFPNYRRMKALYPWLEKHPLLLPYAWIKRVVSTVKLNKSELRRQLYIMQHGNSELSKEIKALWKECGIE